MPKRIRPRFSVRTLVILVTLVCMYAACWGPTKTRGVEDVGQHTLVSSSSVTPIAPLILRTQARYPCSRGPDIGYYVWCFGYVAELSYEREARTSDVNGTDAQRFIEVWERVWKADGDNEGAQRIHGGVI